MGHATELRLTNILGLNFFVFLELIDSNTMKS